LYLKATCFSLDIIDHRQFKKYAIIKMQLKMQFTKHYHEGMVEVDVTVAV